MYQGLWAIIFFIILLNNSFAENLASFKHIKLKSFLQERQRIIASRDDYNNITLKTKGQDFARFGSPNFLAQNDKNLAKLLKMDIGDGSFSTSSLKSARPQEFFGSLIYQSILTYLLPNHNNIGKQQTQAIIDHRDDFDLGQMNFSGFTWQKPMGNYSLYVNRELRPDPSNPNAWIAYDTFEFTINAQTLLERLVDASLISLEGIGVEAFAGINFKRTYNFVHYHNSYEQALTADYSKLFLPFIQFQRSRVLQQAPYTILKKFDHLTFNAGASVETPPVYGFDLKGGIYTKISRMASVTAQTLGPDDNPEPDESVRISIDKKLSVAAGVQLDLQLDFFKLLKLTLLSYELEYEFEKDDQIHLSLPQYDIAKLESNSELGKEFQGVLNLTKLKVRELEPYVTTLEQRESQNLSSKYSALIFGKVKKSQREQVNLIKDGIVTKFYRETQSNIAVVQSWLSRLWATVIYKLFEFESNVKNVSAEEFRYQMEYDAQRVQNERAPSSTDFSLRIDHELFLKKTHGLTKRYKKRAIEMVKRSTNLPNEIAVKLDNLQLRGPLNLKSTLQINTLGLQNFAKRPSNQVYQYFIDFCGSKKANKWLKQKSRAKALRRIQIGAESCVKNLIKPYEVFHTDYSKYKEYDLKSLSKMTKYLLKKSKGLLNIKRLFGVETTFLHGSLSATTNMGQAFTTYFNHGTFDGLGVIESFNRFNDVEEIKLD